MEQKIGQILWDLGLWFTQFCRSRIGLNFHVNLLGQIRSLEKHSPLISASHQNPSNFVIFSNSV